jgi:copper chaperone NosL
MRKKMVACLVALCLTVLSYARAQEGAPTPQKERCPVCGMFVSMFADWNTEIRFNDSTRAIFDGPKDMFKYYLDMGKYNPSKGKDQVTAILVKDYFSRTSIDALKAFYVIWSDVYGPMGHEPIPFGKEADAKKFLKEHKGKKIMRFKEITQKVIHALDNP